MSISNLRSQPWLIPAVALIAGLLIGWLVLAFRSERLLLSQRRLNHRVNVPLTSKYDFKILLLFDWTHPNYSSSKATFKNLHMLRIACKYPRGYRSNVK